MNWFTKSAEGIKAMKRHARYRYIEQELRDAQQECAALGVKIGRLMSEREELRLQITRKS